MVPNLQAMHKGKIQPNIHPNLWCSGPLQMLRAKTREIKVGCAVTLSPKRPKPRRYNEHPDILSSCLSVRNRNIQCFELELSFAFENKKLNGNLWYIDDNTPMEFPKATRPKPVWQERLQFWLHGWNPAATDGKVWSGCNLLESFSPTLRALRRDVIRGIEIEKPQYDGICITERSSEHLEELIILPHNSFPQRRSWQVKFACCFKSLWVKLQFCF